MLYSGGFFFLQNKFFFLLFKISYVWISFYLLYIRHEIYYWFKKKEYLLNSLIHLFIRKNIINYNLKLDNNFFFYHD